MKFTYTADQYKEFLKEIKLCESFINDELNNGNTKVISYIRQRKIALKKRVEVYESECLEDEKNRVRFKLAIPVKITSLNYELLNKKFKYHLFCDNDGNFKFATDHYIVEEQLQHNKFRSNDSKNHIEVTHVLLHVDVTEKLFKQIIEDRTFENDLESFEYVSDKLKLDLTKPHNLIFHF